jgi:hypothetical protein
MPSHAVGSLWGDGDPKGSPLSDLCCVIERKPLAKLLRELDDYYARMTKEQEARENAEALSASDGQSAGIFQVSAWEAPPGSR